MVATCTVLSWQHSSRVHTYIQSCLQEYGFQNDARVPFQFSIDEVHLEMLPLDHDVITLDIHNAYLVSDFLFYFTFGEGGVMVTTLLYHNIPYIREGS